MRTGKEAEAVKLEGYFKDGFYDYDLTHAPTCWACAAKTGRWRSRADVAQPALAALAADAWFKIGNIYASAEARDDAKALEATLCMTSVPEQQRESLRQQIPVFTGRNFSDEVSPKRLVQISASKG